MLDNLAENAAVATPNDEHLLGIRVRVHGQVSDHLLVRELITLSSLDDIVQDEHVAIVGRFKYQDILILALFMVEDLLDLEGHGLA